MLTFTWGIALLVSLAIGVVELFALIDAAIRPGQAYVAAGISWSKGIWIGVLLAAVLIGRVFLFLALAGLVAAIVYLVDVRPKLRQVQGKGDRRSMGPYGPW